MQQPEQQQTERRGGLSSFAATVFEEYNQDRVGILTRNILDIDTRYYPRESNDEYFELLLSFAGLDSIVSIHDFMQSLVHWLDNYMHRVDQEIGDSDSMMCERLVLFLRKMWAKICEHVLPPYREAEWERQVMWAISDQCISAIDLASAARTNRVNYLMSNVLDVLVTGISSRPLESKVNIVALVERVCAIGPVTVNKPLQKRHQRIFQRVQLEVKDPRFRSFLRIVKQLGMTRGIPAASREYRWKTRKPYVALMERVGTDKDWMLRYLSNEFVMRDVCSYMEDVPEAYLDILCK